MTAARVLTRAQARAAALRDEAGTECLIRRPTGVQTDTGSGHVTKTYGDPLYEGPCRLQAAGAGARAARENVAEADVLLQRRELQLPLDGTDGLQPGDEVLITVAPTDPDLVGRTFVLRDLASKTHATQRRVQVEEAT